MPGFAVQGVGDGLRSPPASGRAQFYYVYTWGIERIFQDHMGGSGYTTSSHPPIIYLKDATMPTFNVDKELAMGASLQYKFAKSVTWEDVRLVWYDTLGMLAIMQEWRKRVWSQEFGLAHAAEYKAETQLNVSLPTMSGTVSWKLINSWPSIIRHGDLTYTNSEVKLVEVVLTYDWADEIPSSRTSSSP